MTRVPPRYAFTFLRTVLVIRVFPASVACGRGAPAYLGWLALPAGSAFFALSLAVWRMGVRHYTGTGS